MKVVKLSSGAELKYHLAPFVASRALYQAVLEEAKGLKLDPKAEVDVNLFKDLFCSALCSKKIEAALWECLKKARYNDSVISEETFEPENARGDYIEVLMEVGKENILPFMKTLTQQYLPMFTGMMTKLK